MKKIGFLCTMLIVLLTSCDTKESKIENHPPASFQVNVSVNNAVATIMWDKEVADPDGDKVLFSVVSSDGKIIQSGISTNYYVFPNVMPNVVYSGWVVASDGRGGETKVEYRFESSFAGEKGSEAYESGVFVIPASLSRYYSGVNFSLKGDALKDELAKLTIAKHTRFLEYEQRHQYLYRATEDPKNPNNVILIYDSRSVSKSERSRTFNTEHVYPKSFLPGGVAPNDVHNFYPCTIKVNSDRGNKPFADGSGAYHNMGAYWFPGEEWRGDIARIIFYINIRYNDPIERVSTGGVAMLLKWNVQDPVSDLEKQRNEVFEQAQGNRNVFIDNPYLATLIWGGDAPAENRWKK